ncbi:MAG: hypothetical protein HFG55_07675 [Lachnospiraceae bacterium]|nr:hypothetical protein [Lachnospiraceae bacterium]
MRVMEGETREWVVQQQEKELQKLKEQNQMLQKDNEMLVMVVKQLKVTLNRLIKRYVTGESKR